MKKNWETYYLYHEGNADQVLKEIVHPAIDEVQYKLKKTVKFFFIRYFENGYHIRLRLLLSPEESPLFRPLLTHHISDSGIKIILKEAQYIPETERYGNSDTIVYAENQFYASSCFVLNQLTESIPLTVSERYSIALNTHLAFFKGMGLSSEYSLHLCDKFVESWLPIPVSFDANEKEQYKESLLSAFQRQFDLYKDSLYKNAINFWNLADTSRDPFTLQFIETNREVNKKYTDSHLSTEAIDEALLSFIHMTNNRIGIINSEESYLLFLVRQTITLIKDYDHQ
ncbi:thiopeptide-type bacteriocin biosynthesis protein [Elizabethkingia ursingii]|uniref:thiopeptide-type bacteriocin biosynthesis protein n=1 Tax=Elizabethkingia ursingii TaxID=1756150 RepID=UPI002011FD3B|nr:thiopeptide-type bacteriocin biosynthesis protein [Elizabethkingia ursingii]MCL1671186.1 thiopeptide-type bacteriocin biosynthesis protein [Elizabethkingia ursingii]